MKEGQTKQLYETPEVGVYETKVKAFICQSTPNSTDPYDREIW